MTPDEQRPTADGQESIHTDETALLRNGWFWLAFAVGMILLQSISMDYAVGPYDEGLSLYGALRVLHGQLPYRDFWTMYGPGQFYLLALFFKLFGVYAMWGRVFFVLTGTVTLAVVFALATMLTRRRTAAVLVTAAALIALSGQEGNVSYDFPLYPALSLCLMASLCVVVRWRSGRLFWMGAAGVATGAAALFRHDVALYAAVALLLASAWFQAGKGGAGWKRFLADGALFSAAVLVVFLPVVIWLLVRVPVADLVYSLFYVPARIYPKVRRLPFPALVPALRYILRKRHIGGSGLMTYLHDDIVYLPFVALVVALLSMSGAKARAGLARWQEATYLMLGLLTALMLVKGMVRVSPQHMVQAIVPSMVLLGCLLMRWRVLSRTGQLALAAGACLAGLMLLFPLHNYLRRCRTDLTMLRDPSSPTSFRAICHPAPGLERDTCLSVDPDDAKVALYLQQHTTPGETIFDGAMRHDILFANKISLYFLAKRESATKWHDLHPGVETTAPIQDEMIRQLDANRAVYVIRDSFLGTPAEPNDSRISSGVYDLDRYIDANYRAEARIGTMTLLRRCTRF